VPFLKFSRDRRGYEHFYLVHQTTRRGTPRNRILYWYRTPPGVKVGRLPFDDDVRRALERQNPDVSFDWRKLLETPIPPPAADVERWRERRRVDREMKQAARSELAEMEEMEEMTETSELTQVSELTEVSEAAAAIAADAPEEQPPLAAVEQTPAVATVAALAPARDVPDSGEAASSGRRRRRRRRGRRGRSEIAAPAVVPAEHAPRSETERSAGPDAAAPAEPDAK
jgi:hypothetical protein